MALPRFAAFPEVVPAAPRELVICLGRPDVLPPLPEDRLMVLDEVDNAALERLAGLAPVRMAAGVILVTTRREHARNPKAVLRAQKLLVFLYTKYVEMPFATTRVPDPLGLRPQNTPPEYLHLMNRYRNTPGFLRHSMVDKLRDTQVGLPCLLLLPGPSLRLLKPHLAELSRRYLLVTISRALPMLRECGVAPDVLVQLDTVPLQEHFHHPDERFPKSVLLALSLAPVQSFAPRFRQVFFIDSFNLSILPNPARLRESWLSSMLACLGAAEALHAPKILLAGADLRVHGNDFYYDDRLAPPPEQPYTDPLHCLDGFITMADAKGNRMVTTMQFLATAAEAEMMAREIAAAQPTSFHSLSKDGILDPEAFPFSSLDEVLAAPVLDKTPFLEKADRAAAIRERVNLPALVKLYTDDLADARQSRDILSCLRLNNSDAVEQHPYYQYAAANMPWFRPAGTEGLRRLAANLSEEMCGVVRFARNVAALHLLAAKGKTIPVLCTAEEEEEATARLGRAHPGWKWRFLGIHGSEAGRPAPSGGNLGLAVLHDWLNFQSALIVAPGCAREYRYALALVTADNVLPLDEFLADAPLC